MRFLDNVCMLFSVLMPMTAIPQIYKLYYFQNADGIAIWMWILHSIAIIPFLLYGIVHKVHHIIILNVLWLVVQMIMIVGIVMYG